MMREPVDILIPTYDNADQLGQCIQSIFAYRSVYPVKAFIINNGKIPLEKMFAKSDSLVILKPGKNLGWTGALAYGLRFSKSKYVLFANDDIFIPRASIYWLKNLVRDMELFPKVGAIGPSTNIAMGTQNIWFPRFGKSFEVTYLIGFCMLVRRKALDQVGGIDKNFKTGDDLELSIRLRKAGYILEVLNDVFIYHHGFQTGMRVYGGPEKPGGWNSRQMSEQTNKAIIQKHGFLSWYETMKGGYETGPSKKENDEILIQTESDLVKKYIKGKRIVELGCGGNKTVENAVGIDRVPKGEEVPFMNVVSVADIEADVTQPLPLEDNSVDTIIARHILEHCIDAIEVLKNWSKCLKPGGRLIIAVPDERMEETIPLNPEHVHAFTPESLEHLAECAGLRRIGLEEFNNNMNFVSCFEK